jgi:hypothetical protein
MGMNNANRMIGIISKMRNFININMTAHMCKTTSHSWEIVAHPIYVEAATMAHMCADNAVHFWWSIYNKK